MRPAKWLQEMRLMRCEEVYESLQRAKKLALSLSRSKQADLPGFSSSC